MEPETIRTSEAPAPAGFYNQGRSGCGLIFTAGQIGKDPETGKVVRESFQDEVRQLLKNLLGIVEAGGGTRESFLKATVYLTDLQYFQELNEVFEEFFGDHPPARTCVKVAGLPTSEARVEIEAMALRVNES